MSSRDVSLEQLLSRMGRSVHPVDATSVSDGRKARIVPKLRSQHAAILHRQRRVARTRRFVSLGLVAAVSMLAGSALAGLAGVGPLSSVLDETGPNRNPAVRAEPKLTRGSAAAAIKEAAVAPVAQPTSPDASSPLEPRRAAAAPAVPKSAGAATHVSSTVDAPASQLEVVNRLFADAKRARRDHRDAEALALLEQLLARYPRSVLAHEASVERFRALARLGRQTEARRFASQYLAAFPKGYAAEEARQLIGGAEAGP
jgi:hypothetical protein